MDRVEFLRDIEDETRYSQAVELAYVFAYEGLDEIIKVCETDVAYRPRGSPDVSEWTVSSERLAAMRFTMSLVIRDFADRRARLADVSRGLSDVVVDKEGPEEELGSDPDR